MDNAMEIYGLVKRYGAVEALRGVDLTVSKGSDDRDAITACPYPRHGW